MMITHRFHIRFDTKAFSHGSQGARKSEFGSDGIEFFQIRFGKTGATARVRVSLEGDVEAFAIADSGIDALLDQGPFALQTEDFVVLLDSDFVSCEMDEDFDARGVFGMDGGNDIGVVCDDGHELGMIWFGMAEKSEVCSCAVC